MRFHIVKRDAFPLWKRLAFYLGAVVIALLLGAVVLMAIGVNPVDYYWRMFTMGMVGNKIAYRAFENYLKVFVPLVVTSVALSLAFKMRFWNIGGEGQFILGAVAAAAVAFQAGPLLPEPLTLVLMCLAAMLAAGLYGVVTAVFKVKFGTSETLLTLMLNYVALYFITFLGETKAAWNFFLEPSSARPIFTSFSSLAEFPAIPIGKFHLNVCVILAVLIGVGIYFYLKYTKHGYEIAVVGDSIGTARYAGMKVNRIITAGILSTAITDDVGWTGIIVAWLAKLNTGVIFLVSALIGVLQYGSAAAAATFAQVDSSFADMLQGAILFLVLAADFFTRFRVVPSAKGGNSNGNG